MSNRAAILVSLAIVVSILTLIVVGETIRSKRIEQAASLSDTIPEREPGPLPIPTEPTTALPIISLEPPSTTTSRPAPTTTTTYELPEPGVQGTAVTNTDGVTLDDYDIEKWREIALCEMPGPGGVPSEPWGAHWSFKGGRFSGAFGIANTTWLGAGGGKYGPTAGHATWQQQIEIARVIRDRYGYSAWGCG